MFTWPQLLGEGQEVTWRWGRDPAKSPRSLYGWGRVASQTHPRPKGTSSTGIGPTWGAWLLGMVRVVIMLLQQRDDQLNVNLRIFHYCQSMTCTGHRLLVLCVKWSYVTSDVCGCWYEIQLNKFHIYPVNGPWSCSCSFILFYFIFCGFLLSKDAYLTRFGPQDLNG